MAVGSQRQAIQQPTEHRSRQRQAETHHRGRLPHQPLGTPAADRLQQLVALANNSPRTAQLRSLQELANNSPRATELRQLQALATSPKQSKEPEPPGTPQIAKPTPNRTGLPDALKSGIEALSGVSMDQVRVHYNSAQPARLNALAYAQGTDIHLAPGQERHLPHEAWHVVQQAQGRVRPTMQMKDGVQVNDDAGLEREADVMGSKALEGGHRVAEAHRSISMPMETAQTIKGDATNCPDKNVSNNGAAPLANGRGSAKRGGNEIQRMADQRPEAALQRQVQAWGDGRGGWGKGQDLTPGFQAIAQRKLQNMIQNSAQVKQLKSIQLLTGNENRKNFQQFKSPVIQRFSFIARLKHHDWTLKNKFTFEKNAGTLYPSHSGDLMIAKDVAHQATMAAALQYAATRFTEVGNMANRIRSADGGMSNAPNPRYANTMYPFVFEIAVPFGNKKNTRILTLRYQYANNATGYIISQVLSGEGQSDMVNVPNDTANAGYTATYFSTHGDTGDFKLLDLTEQDADRPEKENAERLDARTKLAGEGARFNVVKENILTITDNTIIYTEDGTHAYCVRFRSLWMNWAHVFNSEFGISNDKLAAKLKNPSLWRQDYPPKEIEKKNLLNKDKCIKV